MQNIRFRPGEVLDPPAPNPFLDEERAEDLYFTLSEAVALADRDGRLRFVRLHEGKLVMTETPPTRPRELHLVCIPDADPVFARGIEYEIVSAAEEPEDDREQMRLIS